MRRKPLGSVAKEGKIQHISQTTQLSLTWKVSKHKLRLPSRQTLKKIGNSIQCIGGKQWLKCVMGSENFEGQTS